MPYLFFESWDIGEAQEALEESYIQYKAVGATLDEELKTEAFLENINRFSQSQFDEFLKSLK